MLKRRNYKKIAKWKLLNSSQHRKKWTTGLTILLFTLKHVLPFKLSAVRNWKQNNWATWNTYSRNNVREVMYSWCVVCSLISVTTTTLTPHRLCHCRPLPSHILHCSGNTFTCLWLLSHWLMCRLEEETTGYVSKGVVGQLIKIGPLYNLSHNHLGIH